MKAGSSMKPQKAQVKDKGLGAESGDFRLRAPRFLERNKARSDRRLLSEN
jgi:hypothetical protein